MTQTVIFPGTFDPVTNGHVDLVRRAAKQFGRVVVGVADNPRKQPFFTFEERVNLAEQVFKDLRGVTVIGFSILLVEFAKEQGATAIIRGLRAVSDFEYEFQLASMNQRLAPDVETLFLTPDVQFSFLSSSLVKEIARYKGNITSFVPAVIAQAIQEKL